MTVAMSHKRVPIAFLSCSALECWHNFMKTKQPIDVYFFSKEKPYRIFIGSYVLLL